VDPERTHRATWIDRLVAASAEPVNVQLSSEPGVRFPVEVFADRGPGFVAPGSLGLSQQLERDLIDWLHWWEHHVSPGGDAVVAGDDAEWWLWGQEGQRLRQALQRELGEEFLVRGF
jgi:hypothetical protein